MASNNYDSTSNPPIPRLSGVPYLCHDVTPAIARTPTAPQGPSNEELNRLPPDPYLPPFGGSASLLMDLVAGTSMINDRVTSVMSVKRKQR
jgi:hypothetical protein